jgi:pimeloyl-ACP methyl ester carboxylesterase
MHPGILLRADYLERQVSRAKPLPSFCPPFAPPNLVMKCTVFTILAGILIGYAGLCAALFAFQRSLLYYPQPRAIAAPESTMRLPAEGADLVVSVRPHDGPKAIIYFGGNAEDVSRNLESFSEVFPEHALYLLHYRGYGGSTGRPTEQANHSDAAALFRKVHALHSEVVIFGRSLGTGIAVRLASQSPASRLILVTPYDSIAEIAASAFPYVPVKWLLIDRYESGSYAPSVTIPTTIIAAENDEEIPRASTERLLSRFGKGVATMTVIQGVGHNDLGSKIEYRKTLQSAL